MQTYYFYRHTTEQSVFLAAQSCTEHELLFKWVDCLRSEVVQHKEQWQQHIHQLTDICINEFHLQDILNIEHPCVFDPVEDYDLLIFRKLITPDDEIGTAQNAAETHDNVFGLASTPVSFLLSQHALVTVREQGNRPIEAYIQRFNQVLQRQIDEQNKPRKLSSTPIDLALRLLNSMVDGYLDIRKPLTRRVEYWQQELLQGNRRFKQWQQLFQEDMAFQQVENLCEEQIEMLQELRDEIVDNFNHLVDAKQAMTQELLLLRVNDLMSHVERIQKHTHRLGGAIQSAIDIHFNAIANQTNENMRILAIITAVFAPLTLLTGIYGMNFEVLPGSKSPQGFWVMMAVMITTTVALLYYFYRQHLVGRGERSVIDLLADQHRQRSINLTWLLDYEPIKQTNKEVEKMVKR